ncbi:TadA [Schleiferilactobacillus shenzhenensis LY-73]|uniref:tRNA-specific adenosine deaminase n=2 Tax=Schleiferilactobacillus shenzhenensis TaxID=1231337 RepID=U4TY94_9LACO|nr:TadA [Schleiferilactobacillus shenzhenensis LY-73]
MSSIGFSADAVQYYMGEALKEADAAGALGEVPIGAVIVDDGGEIIGRGHNLREIDHDPTAHAEMIAIRQACAQRSSWRLTHASLFVTLEPCPMCAGAIINARLDAVYYGAPNPKAGSAGTLINLLDFPGYNHRVPTYPGVRGDEAAQRMKAFFKRIRNELKAAKKAARLAGTDDRQP